MEYNLIRFGSLIKIKRFVEWVIISLSLLETYNWQV